MDPKQPAAADTDAAFWDELKKAGIDIGPMLLRSFLAQKKLAVMRAVESAPMTGYNKHFDYTYASESDYLGVLRGPMMDNNLAFSHSVVEVVSMHHRDGSKMIRCEMLIECTLTDAETGFSETILVACWGVDTEDKAPYKALTGGVKYALAKWFLIPTHDDPEVPARTGQNKRGKAKRTKQPKPKQSKPKQSKPTKLDPNRPIQDTQVNAVNRMMDKLGASKSDVLRVAGTMFEKQFKNLREMTFDQGKKLIDRMQHPITKETEA